MEIGYKYLKTQIKAVQELRCPNQTESMFLKSTKVFLQKSYIPHLTIKIDTSTNFVLAFTLAIENMQSYCRNFNYASMSMC